MSFWKAATKHNPGPVLSTHTSAKVQHQQLERDHRRKRTVAYKRQRRSTRNKNSTATTDHYYGPDSQQDDFTLLELLQLCQEFYDRELNISNNKCNYIEQNTRNQSEDSLWHQQRKSRLTASNFGRVVPVGNLLKSLLYSKTFSTEATRWGSTHKNDAKQWYLEYLRIAGHANASVKDSGLVIDLEDPCRACSPDSLVNIPGEAGGIVVKEIKCPYTAAKEGLDPASAAKTKKNFFCKAGDTGKPELKQNHDYFHQVQGTMAITKRSWCNFDVWTPMGISVEHVPFDSRLWAETKSKLLNFYKKAVLPKLTLPRHMHGQPIWEPTSGDDITT